MTRQAGVYRTTGRAARRSSGAGQAQAQARRPAPAALLLAPGATARDAWIAWLSPRFADLDSAYLTGTYSDEYGYPHGLTLARNVHKDFRRFLADHHLEERQFINGVEHHQYRDILHLHAIIEGPFAPGELLALKRCWERERGHAKALPVLDGCTSYVTKYALKGDTEAFDWSLT